MARTAKVAIHTVGPVQVYERPDGRHRLVASIDGRQVERSGTRDVDVAKERAETWARELGMPNPAVHGGAYFRDTVVDFLEFPHPKWGRNHRDRFEGFARNHINPGIGKKRNNEIDAKVCFKLLKDLAEAGYSWSLVHGVFTLIKAVVNHGRHTGVWQPAFNPVYGLTMPAKDDFTCDVPEAGIGNVLVLDAAELPTEEETEQLIHRLGLLDDDYALMGELSAECGLRYGELVGSCPEQWNKKTLVFTVDRQLVEYDDGTAEWKLPKHEKVRAVPVPSRLADRLTARCEAATREFTFFDRRTKQNETRCLLFTGPRGGWWRRSNFNRRVARPCMDDAEWPATLTWHDLRHRFCVSMLKQLAAAGGTTEVAVVADVAKLAGHHSPDFTMKKYIHADSGVLDRARAAQRKAEKDRKITAAKKRNRKR